MLRTLIRLTVVLAVAVSSRAADFTLREQLGHSWTNECVTFPLTPAQAAQARKKLALVGPGDKELPYQLTARTGRDVPRICFQADLPPLVKSRVSFLRPTRRVKVRLENSRNGNRTDH